MTPKQLTPTKITLSCPICKRTRKADRHSTDPIKTVKIVVSCPKCNPSGFDDVSYFDEAGEQLYPE